MKKNKAMKNEDFSEPTDIDRRLSRLTKVIRKILNVDQKKLAKAAGISLDHYCSFENGEKTVSINMLDVICKEMDIHIIHLYKIIAMEDEERNFFITDALFDLADSPVGRIPPELRKTLTETLEMLKQKENLLN